jgi:hypothetical protein
VKHLFLKSWLAGSFCLVLNSQFAQAQCKITINKATGEKVHYHRIPLGGTHEYLILSRTGDERIFSYNNTKIELVFPVHMFTEIRFITPKDKFSIFTTSSYRSRWQTLFTLSTPLTKKEVDKMDDANQIQLVLPEEVKKFSLTGKRKQLMDEAMKCLR